MARREDLAVRMAAAVVKRLATRRLVEVKDEGAAREAVKRVLVENLLAEEKLEGEARQLLLSHAKEIRDSASDYRRLLALVKSKLARERGFVL